MQIEEEDYANNYGNLLPKEKIELIHERARLKGIRRQDLDDLLQIVVQEVLAFKYDPEKSNGATETTALVAMIDNRIFNFRREAARYRVRVKRTEEEDPRNVIEPSYCLTEQEVLADSVAAAVATLPRLERKICALLSQGFKRNEVEDKLNLTRWEYRQSEEKIAAALRQKGLGG